MNGFYDSLIAQTETSIREGFVHESFRNLIVVSSEPVELLELIENYVKPKTLKWCNDSDT